MTYDTSVTTYAAHDGETIWRTGFNSASARESAAQNLEISSVETVMRLYIAPMTPRLTLYVMDFGGHCNYFMLDDGWLDLPE